MADLTLYYVTNRNHVGKDYKMPEEYGSGFSADGVENLRFGKVIVEVDEDRINGYLCTLTNDSEEGDGTKLTEYLEKQFRDNGKINAFAEILDKKTQIFGSQTMFEELKIKMMKSTDTLVYVHGYAVSWHSAVASALSL